MDFSFTEDQGAFRDLAARIFADRATVERVKETEQSEDRIDWDLWKTLADAGLLDPLGLIETCLLLEQQGRVVAPVPIWPSLVLGKLPLMEFGTDAQLARWCQADTVLTAALSEPGVNDPLAPSVAASADGRRWRLDGIKPAVPAGHTAGAVLVPARTGDGTLGVFLVTGDAEGLQRETAVTTDRSKVAHLTFAGTPAEPLGQPEDGRAITKWMLERALVGLAAIQVGVAGAALRMAADYTSQRHQFGKPLSTFQGVALKAADAYIDTEAIRVTLWQAAWRLANGLDATREVLVAKWWASEGGQRAVHITQHLHGGMGADIDYPVHRYFLWGKQIEDTLGGASATLARLGEVIATGAAT
ncbi:MAG: acyl-CoA dehydrogenase family protein [Acidimicrobiia bacterium]